MPYKDWYLKFIFCWSLVLQYGHFQKLSEVTLITVNVGTCAVPTATFWCLMKESCRCFNSTIVDTGVSSTQRRNSIQVWTHCFFLGYGAIDLFAQSRSYGSLMTKFLSMVLWVGAVYCVVNMVTPLK